MGFFAPAEYGYLHLAQSTGTGKGNYCEHVAYRNQNEETIVFE